MKAIGQKVSVSPFVDLDEVAAATDGFSGADLQALIYNAHLEVIHASLATTSNKQTMPGEDANPVEFTSFGGSKTTSRAEETALRSRVGQRSPQVFPLKTSPF